MHNRGTDSIRSRSPAAGDRVRSNPGRPERILVSTRLAPSTWDDVIVRSFTALVAATLAFAVKEWFEARQVDLFQILLDALWVAGGMLVVGALLRMMRRS